jgi:hypothetical protein
MTPLSHNLASLILPHDRFGTHVNDSCITINPESERTNFKKAEEDLAEVWCGSIIDEYPLLKLNIVIHLHKLTMNYV